MNTAELIDTAIKVLEERGWCQGRLQDEDGRLCLRGALYKAEEIMDPGTKLGTNTGHLHAEANDIIEELIMEIPDESGHVPSFNDRPTTTKEDVILLLKRAREIAEG